MMKLYLQLRNLILSAAFDITTDGRHYIFKEFGSTTNQKFIIVDRAGDNGAGTYYHTELFPLSIDQFSKSIFSYDNKFAYVAYLENQTLKVRIINIAAKTSVTKSIINNFTPTTFALNLSVATDSNRGVLTVQTFNNMPSKSYIFNLTTETNTSFNNNENIFKVTSF